MSEQLHRGSPIVIIKENDFKFDIYEIKIRTSLTTLQTLVLL
jgi:hypothetical protein